MLNNLHTNGVLKGISISVKLRELILCVHVDFRKKFLGNFNTVNENETRFWIIKAIKYFFNY